jgi:hypothetical protein
MKKWLIEEFLPMWAKETVLADNRELRRQIRRLRRKNRSLQAYIRGMRAGIRLKREEQA